MDRVRADTLSDKVPDVMIVDMNFCVERDSCMVLYADESCSKSASAYDFRLSSEVEKRSKSPWPASAEGRLLTSIPYQSDRGSNI